MIFSFWSVKGSPQFGSLFPTLPLGRRTINHPCAGCYRPSLRFFADPLGGKKSNVGTATWAKTQKVHLRTSQTAGTNPKSSLYLLSPTRSQWRWLIPFYFSHARDVWHIWEYVFKLIYQNWDEMVSWTSGYKIQDANLSHTHFNAVPDSQDL